VVVLLHFQVVELHSQAGKWKCGNCIEREIQDKIIKVTPNSDRAKEIIAERAAKQKKELEFKRLEAQVRKIYGRRSKI
jgi:hypothetical protein